MVIRNVTRASLLAAAGDVGEIRLEVEDRSNSRRAEFRVRLFPIGDSRRTFCPISGRRKNACSWQAHADFFRALYRLEPRADIRTACPVGAGSRVRYTSPEQFEDTHEDTGWHSVVGPYWGSIPYRDTGE